VIQEDTSFLSWFGREKVLLLAEGDKTYIILHLNACSTGTSWPREGVNPKALVVIEASVNISFRGENP
jgi:hypothetical protein